MPPLLHKQNILIPTAKNDFTWYHSKFLLFKASPVRKLVGPPAFKFGNSKSLVLLVVSSKVVYL